MPIRQPHQIVTKALITTLIQVGRCDISSDGTITQIRLNSDFANPNGATEFDVRLDGVSIYATTPERPEIAMSANLVEQTGLSVAATKGQELTLHTTIIQAGGIGNYLVFTATLEEPAAYVELTGNQTVAGIKTFSSSPIVPTPTTGLQAVTKDYVDAIGEKPSVRMATTTTLPACTYANGTGGVGATLTGNSNGALSAQDGVTPVAANLILVKDQASGLQNGVYTVTQLGTGGTPFILTRVNNADNQAKFLGLEVNVQEGTLNADTKWVCTTNATITVGTTALVFARITVGVTGDQTIAGIKTFSSSPIVPTPTTDTQAANKVYVDGVVMGLSWKQAVRVATTAAGTLASSFENGDTVDGVVLATGNRILIKNQAAGAENGIYTVNASGAPTRALDADAGAELVNASCYVSEGTANADKQFVCTNNSPITVGTTALVFTELTTGGGSWGAITGTLSAQTDLQTALDGKVNDTGNETIAGIKTFSSSPIVPTATAGTEAINKDYVDGLLDSAEPISGFQANKNGTDQNYTSATPAQLTFGTEDYDLATEFASSVFTAEYDGKYMFQCAARVTAIGTGTTAIRLLLYKNTSLYKVLAHISTITATLTDITLEGSVLANVAEGDDFEIYVEFVGLSSGTATIEGDANSTWFNAVRLCSTVESSPRVTAIASSSTPTPNADTTDLYDITALTDNATFGAPTGTPSNGQPMIIRIKDDGTVQTLAFNAIYRFIGVTAPTTTVANKIIYLPMIYNSNDTKWDVTGNLQEA